MNVFALFLFVCVLESKIINVLDFGAVINDPDSALYNVNRIREAFGNATDGDTIYIPDHVFYVFGNITTRDRTNLTFKIDGYIRAGYDLKNWPHNSNRYMDIFEFYFMKNFHVTGKGTIDGQGVSWWDQTIDDPSVITLNRPKELTIFDSTNITIDTLKFINSPFYHIGIYACNDVEIHHVNVTVDRHIQRKIKHKNNNKKLSTISEKKINAHLTNAFHKFDQDGSGQIREYEFQLAWLLLGLKGSVEEIKEAFAGVDTYKSGFVDVNEFKTAIKRQRLMTKYKYVRNFLTTPIEDIEIEDLNTDGIDLSGSNIHVHNVYVQNDDDSVAVKGCGSSCMYNYENCTGNVLVENSTLIGFGATIGAVPPRYPTHCVKNVIFRNISMPETGKGIYIKGNPCKGKKELSIIENILYENIQIIEPRWWAIWIGPQQQEQPGADEKCSLSYPHGPCETQWCVTFNNITLRNITIINPWISPGVILGNSTNTMKNIVFDNVQVKNPGWYPFNHEYQCKFAHVKVINSSPSFDCDND